ncbi:MAG TPA: DUF2723 domain-containing protein [bacterium]|nr:DUF2723 domain-containing protein [bacterium]HQN73323.1 DUF2723 domain-containing protein [bacterium]HQO91681.1 DUF2723 domain-containing protein [bacterium]
MSGIRRFFIKHWFVFIPFFFYYFTMATKMALGDVALMVHRMVILELGIHPNLHNLAMLVGNLFLKLPFGTVIYKANLFTVVFGAASVISFYFLLNKLGLRKFVTVASSFIFMVSHSVWWHSTMAENYILHVFMIIVILICLVDYTQRKVAWPLYLSFFLAGLSFFNHVQNGVWWGGCYLFILFNFFDIQKNSTLPYFYRKIFKEKRSFVFYWVFAVSSFYLLLGVLPYLILLFRTWAAKGYDLAKTFNHGTGGEFKNIMFNFDNMSGFYQSFWYHLLQFPTPFYFLTVLGLLYFVFGWFISRTVKPSENRSMVEKVVLATLLTFSVLTALTFGILFHNGAVFEIFGTKLTWFRYDSGIRMFVSNVFIALFLMLILQRKGLLKDPFKGEYWKVFYSALILPFVVTLVFFQFYNTWDQFQFLLPCFIILALFAAVVFNQLVEIIENNKSKSILYSVYAVSVLSVIFPVWYYQKISDWSVDPSSWWFDFGPYSDQRFLNSHNRSEYNNNPNKRNYDDVDEFVNLLFAKLPQNATILDDDSRMFYPIHLYYRKYADREDKGRPDINLKMINVWGHKNWGTTVDRVVREVNAVNPGEENYFLIANRNYPHFDVIKKLDHNDRTFLPWKLSNNRWIYKLKVFTPEEKNRLGSFPPLSFNYMYFGADFDTNGLNLKEKFKADEKIEARVTFVRLPKNIEPFDMVFVLSDASGNKISEKKMLIKGGWKGLRIPLGTENLNLKNGTYEVVVTVKNIEIFRRSFEIK